MFQNATSWSITIPKPHCSKLVDWCKFWNPKCGKRWFYQQGDDKTNSCQILDSQNKHWKCDCGTWRHLVYELCSSCLSSSERVRVELFEFCRSLECRKWLATWSCYIPDRIAHSGSTFRVKRHWMLFNNLFNQIWTLRWHSPFAVNFVAIKASQFF